MPVPFRDAEEIAELGAAGYLKIDAAAEGSALRGALLLINARGEPLEFVFNHIEIPNSFLWPRDGVRRHAVRKLTVSLLEACQRVPQFILCLADEVYHELFCNEIHLSVPVCRIASFTKATAYSSLERQDTIDEPQPLNLFWFPGKPADNSVEQQLLTRLVAHGLILEPFDRARVGLNEVFPHELEEARE